MAFQQVTVELYRDGAYTPWGFRLTGGADIGAPLVIQKVNLGSPSEGELCRGDVILRIKDAEARCLSHHGATELIAKSGNNLRLVVARCGLVSSVPIGLTTPGTPTTLYHLKAGGATSPPPMLPLLTPSDGNQNLFKPLPTTNFAAHPQNRRMSVESYASTASSETEKEAIVNQPYRTVPLITPSVKTTKDFATGSYLRHEPLNRTSTPPNISSRLNDAYMINKVQEAVIEAAQTASRTPTPDMGHQNGPQVYLRQYNSPINIYSNQAIADTIMAQTSAMKPQWNDVGIRDPTKTPLNITTSPTYQLVQDEEFRNLHKGKMKEHRPLEERIHNVDGCHPREDIHQSGSYKMLKNTLHGINEI